MLYYTIYTVVCQENQGTGVYKMFVKIDTEKSALEKLYDPDILPNGERFSFWECKTKFTKTLIVDQNHPNASDDGDGSEAHPYKTVSAAAAAVKPCERILIKKGKYFETVRDIKGGTDEEHMVMIEGEDGAVITGAIEWKPKFEKACGYRETPIVTEFDLFHKDESTFYSQSGAKVYMGDLPADGSLYEYGYNPFFVLNLHALSWIPTRDSYPRVLMPEIIGRLNRDEHLRRRGEVYVNGRRLEQAVRYYELFEREDVFFVDEAYKRLHLHLKDNANPADCHIEITLKEQGFMPREARQGYIYFKNVSFEKFANPIKVPQYGALSSNCGHHFIIEGCRFSDIHSVGLDLGFISHNFIHHGIRGHHIVRGNLFERCGISGMAAVPTMGYYLENMLVEENRFLDNGYLNFELIYESAALKSHFTKNSLYRRNYISGMNGSGIWLDNHNMNTRVCENVIEHIHNCPFGAVFNEATLNAVLVDHNIVSDVTTYHFPDGKSSGGHGIYQHVCEQMVVWENICLNTEGDAVYFEYTPKCTRYIWDNPKRAALHKDNTAIGNLIQGCRHGIALATEKERSDSNFIKGAAISECYIISDGEHHSRESFLSLFGFESADSPVCEIKQDGDGISVRTKGGKELSLSVIPTKTDLLGFFQKINE